MNSEHKLYKEALSAMMPDFETVRRQAKTLPAVRPDRQQHRCFVPALAAGCAAAVLGLMVSPVGASLVSFFSGDSGRSAAAYLNTPAYERPELENAVVQHVSDGDWQIWPQAGKDFSWGSMIGSAAVEEALYDSGSEELTLRYTVDGSAFGLLDASTLVSALADGELSAADGPFACLQEGLLLEDASAIGSAEDLAEAEEGSAAHSAHLPQNVIAGTDGGRVQITGTYGLPRDAAGGQLALLIPCAAAEARGDGSGDVRYEQLGFLQVPFRLEPAAAAYRSAPAGTYFVGGHPLQITKAALGPTGLEIAFTLPGELASGGGLDFNIYADGELVAAGTGEERPSWLDYLMEDADGIMEGRILVPFAGTGISEVTLVPCERGSGRPVTGDVITLQFG